MGGPAPPLLKVPPLPKAMAQWTRRLRRLAGPRGVQGSSTGPAVVLDPLQEAGRQLRLAREARGLGLRQLASETRISTAVLEALEKGWRDRLPEPTYLRTMLPLLERHLELPGASLQGALPVAPSPFQAVPSRQPLLRRFTPGSIDVFTSWQGSLLYGLLTVVLIHLLNLQQFRLAERGLLSARPLPTLADPRSTALTPSDPSLREAFPDLQPIRQAARGQGLRQLRREGGGPGVDLSLGVLDLTTAAPTRLDLQGAGGTATRLTGIEGKVALPVLPPFRLVLDPPPSPGSVLWQGRPLAAERSNPASYRYPPPAPTGAPAAAPAAPRP